MIPEVLPGTSAPSRCVGRQPVQSLACSSALAEVRRRVEQQALSPGRLWDWSGRSGVLVTVTPAARAASRSRCDRSRHRSSRRTACGCHRRTARRGSRSDTVASTASACSTACRSPRPERRSSMLSRTAGHRLVSCSRPRSASAASRRRRACGHHASSSATLPQR
ncbi:hypothetical protein HBB16_09155 [Pseudonocardia sp. MCCB 268]|nr:hypothetical protein [Pseudonocardia cytotoxica]